MLQRGIALKLVFQSKSACTFFHDVLECKDAESRLEGREGAYLFRESDVKTGLFIISHVKNSSVSHLVTPNRNESLIDKL